MQGYVRRWYSLAAAAALEFLAGMNALFSLYAPQLRSALHYSEEKLQGLGTATISAGLLAVVPGFLMVAFGNYPRLGPRVIVLTGVALSSIGYFLMWAAATGKVEIPFAVMVFLAMLISDGNVWVDTAATTISLNNFPFHRGYVAGLVKSCRCIGAPMLTMVFSSFQSIQGLNFILFIGLVFLIGSLIFNVFLNGVPYEEKLTYGCLGAELKLQMVTVGVVALSVWQIVVAMVDMEVRVGSTYSLWTMAVGWAFCLAILLILIWNAGGLLVKSDESWVEIDADLENQEPLIQNETSDSIAVTPQDSPRPLQDYVDVNYSAPNAQPQNPKWCEFCMQDSPKASQLGRKSVQFSGNTTQDLADHALRGTSDVGEDSDIISAATSPPKQYTEPEPLTAWQCLKSLRFWILWITQLITNGVGFTLLANMGSQLEAVTGTAEGQQTFVLSNTACKALACMLVGSLSEWLLQDYGLPRLVWVVGAGFCNCLVFLCLVFANEEALLTLVVIQGLVFGATWGITPACTYELLGRKHFAAIQGYMQLATAFGTVLFNTLLAGSVAERKSQEHGDPPGQCFGKDCFRATYITIAMVSFGQAVLCAVLMMFTWSSYKGIRRSLSGSRNLSGSAGRSIASSIRPIPVQF